MWPSLADSSCGSSSYRSLGTAVARTGDVAWATSKSAWRRRWCRPAWPGSGRRQRITVGKRQSVTASRPDAGASGISTWGSSRLRDRGSNRLGDVAVGWESVESGPPDAERRVLLLPGGMCSARSYAEVLAEPTLAEVRLVAVTMPGHAGEIGRAHV